MRFSINIPNFGDFADAGTVATVAVAAEQAGWDGLFVWDHVVHDKKLRRGRPFGDPWMLLTAAALATSRIRLGTLVTPVARRRPQQLARQVATLDALSGGRVIFGAGLGGPIEDEFGSFGEPTDPVVLAERLDEGLDLLAALLVRRAGQPRRPALPGTRRDPAARHGAAPPPAGLDRRLLAAPAADAPRRPLGRRGPAVRDRRHGQIPPVDQVRDLVAYVHRHRDRRGGRSTSSSAAPPPIPPTPRDLIAPAGRRRRHLVGRTPAPDRPRPRPPRPGAAPHQPGPAGALGRLRAPRTRRRSGPVARSSSGPATPSPTARSARTASA